MKQTLYTCDRCKEQIVNPDHVTTLNVMPHQGAEPGDKSWDRDLRDFCQTCWVEFTQFLRAKAV
jgi:hypothetical protein